MRIPRAGGILFVIKSAASPATESHDQSLTGLADPSLLLLADILPTGVFTAIQTIQHPNILPIIKGERFPLASIDVLSGLGTEDADAGGENLKARLLDPMWPSMQQSDRVLVIAVVGLGPVGIVRSPFFSCSAHLNQVSNPRFASTIVRNHCPARLFGNT